MRFAAVSSSVMFEHKPKYWHPENPERLKIVLEVLKELDLPILEAKPIRKEELYSIHTMDYVEKVESYCKKGLDIDADTYTSEGTFEAALTAVGALIPYIDDYDILFAAIRPPGHHAGKKGKAMLAPTNGFCIFNNAAFLAKKLLERYDKVGIFDFDLHHGNGTQEIFYYEPKVIHCDIHQHYATIYPGSGTPEQDGGGKAKGTKININLEPGSGDEEYMDAVDFCMEKLSGCDVVVVSAGFDAYFRDGMSSLKITKKTYEYIGKTLRKNFDKIYIVLEGGYTEGLRKALPSFLKGLLGKS